MFLTHRRSGTYGFTEKRINAVNRHTLAVCKANDSVLLSDST